MHTYLLPLQNSVGFNSSTDVHSVYAARKGKVARLYSNASGASNGYALYIPTHCAEDCEFQVPSAHLLEMCLQIVGYNSCKYLKRGMQMLLYVYVSCVLAMPGNIEL